jgi:hypothetical protein
MVRYFIAGRPLFFAPRQAFLFLSRSFAASYLDPDQARLLKHFLYKIIHMERTQMRNLLYL